MALTGPAAAAIHQLDGFRDQEWPLMWCVPNCGDAAGGIIQVRQWEEPLLREEGPVAPITTVLRHLGARADWLKGRTDGVAPADRIELAVEHAARLGVTPKAARGGRQRAEAELRIILRRRGQEPATESYAETRALQLMRQLGREPWRQIPIGPTSKGGLRADFMIPFRSGPRPSIFRPDHGLLVEVDSREFHEKQFERDHDKRITYDRLGFHFMTITPRQVEKQPRPLLLSVQGALQRGGAVPLTPGPTEQTAA
jgi:hypothetical protein